ncbi:MAG: CYTH domain-containing protein [Candidatus Saccharibacteria bacterium]|nr:CYTH domain-containing protein [Candidatus Saccharibacteria bacterium]
MKKAIVKAKIANRVVLDEKMRELGLEFDPIIWQHDRVYLPRGYRPNMNLPRMIMRTEMKTVDEPAKYYLILKRHISDSGVDIVNQTRVSDYVEAVNMIHQLGFGSAIEVSRRRQAMEIGESAVMYLDEIEKIPGFYLKIETKIEDNEKVSEVMEDLKRTLRLFGQDEKSVVQDTYSDLV